MLRVSPGWERGNSGEEREEEERGEDKEGGNKTEKVWWKQVGEGTRILRREN